MSRDHIQPQWTISSKIIPKSVEEVIDILLRNRNLGPESLTGELKDLSGYLAIDGMEHGADLMARHMKAGHKIVLISDYDCDGITSAAQMALFLTDVGYTKFEVIIPLRNEGYGFPERAVREHADARLFVAMDCGTLDRKPIQLACSTGAECIVIDHHEVTIGETAPASVIINPKHPDCCSAFKEFCSAGLTLIFLAALRRAIRDFIPSVPSLGGKYPALAAIGTVADLVPLVSANRILAKSGLKSLNSAPWAPISMLANAAGLNGKPLTAGHISYYIAPRINAAGRVSDGRIAYDLLTAKEPEELTRLARDLNSLNAARQSEEEFIISSIRAKLSGQLPQQTRTLVLGDSSWPAGVIGIAASRVQQEIQYAPVVILSINEKDGTAKGSARSVPGFDIHKALQDCSDLFLRWGGHKAAAGLTIPIENIPVFSSRFEQTARGYPSGVFIPSGKVDMEIPLALICPELIESLFQLEPHGMGNPAPVFALRDVPFTVKKLFGKEREHIRLYFSNGLEGIFWRGVQKLQGFSDGRKARLDFVAQVVWDSFYGKPSLTIKDAGRLF